MRTRVNKTDYLLSLIREGKKMTLKQQLKLTVYLSIPAIMAQLSSIVMQYVDASMVGQFGSKCIGFYRTGINNDMVVLGIVCSSCNRLLRASGTSYRSWKFCRSKKNFTSIHYCDIAIRLFISSYRSFHQ